MSAAVGRWLCRHGLHTWRIEHVIVGDSDTKPTGVDALFVQAALGIQEECARGCGTHRDALSGVRYRLDNAE